MKAYKADATRMWHLATKATYETKDYAPLAVREGLQNSIDACLKAIEFKEIERGQIDISWEKNDDNSDYTLIISDNGCGMLSDGEAKPEYCVDLDDVYLNLGETNKRDGDTIGGFGIGKAVILGCAQDWIIETRTTLASSSMLGTRNKWERIPYHQGCKITLLKVEGGYSTYLDIERVLMWSELCDNISLTFNGNLISEEIDMLQASKSWHLTLPDVKSTISIFPIEGEDGYAIYRLRGLYQFKERIWDCSCNMIIDVETHLLPGIKEYPFTTSRESVRGDLKEFVSKVKSEVRNNQEALIDNKNEIFEFFKGRQSKTEESKIITAALVRSLPEIKEKSGLAMASLKKNSKGDSIVENMHLTSSFAASIFFNDINPIDIEWVYHWDKNQKYNPMKYDNKIFSKLIFWDIICHTIAKDREIPTFYVGISSLERLRAEYIYAFEKHYITVNPNTFNVHKDRHVTLALLIECAAHELAHISYPSHNSSFVKHYYELYNAITDMPWLINKVKIFDLLK